MFNVPPPPQAPAPIVFDRARASQPLPAVPQDPPAGSLVIIDTFQDTPQKADHGNIGAYSARQHGFEGPIFAETMGPDRSGPSITGAAMNWLKQGPRDPGKVRQSLQNFARFTYSSLLNKASADLDKVRDKGLHDSAVNISYGSQPQRVAEYLLDQVRAGSAPGSPNFHLAQNVFQAYDLDQGKLTHPDLKVAGPERLRLYEALLGAAEKGAQHPEVQEAQERFRQSVNGVQAQSNTVTVSVGNQEQVLENMAQRTGGILPQAGPTSNHNVLAIQEVFTVGATQWNFTPQGLKEKQADYSNRDPAVDIFASGSVGHGVDPTVAKSQGSSFSAPRVGATAAELHRQNPGSDTWKIRDLMQQQLTHELQDSSGETLKVLDYEKTLGFLSDRKF